MSFVRLTDNGRPGYDVEGSGFYRRQVAIAPVARTEGWLAYLELMPARLSLMVWGPSGTAVVDTGSCPVDPSLLAWSPDGRVLAMPCGSSVALYTVADRTTTTLALPVGSSAVAVGWDATGGRVDVAATGRAFQVLALDTGSDSATMLAMLPGRSDLSPIGFSPDGTWLLLAGCPRTKADPACVATELDDLDVATGTLRPIWTLPAAQISNEFARWQPDGSVVLSDPAHPGTIVIDPATGRSTHSAWSIDAQLWLPAH